MLLFVGSTFSLPIDSVTKLFFIFVSLCEKVFKSLSLFSSSVAEGNVCDSIFPVPPNAKLLISRPSLSDLPVFKLSPFSPSEFKKSCRLATDNNDSR